MKIALLLLAASAALAQDVNQIDGPPSRAMQTVLVVNGSNQTIGICWSPSILTTGPRARARVSISTVSKASAAVVTSTAHGFDLNSRPLVTISGATGTGWTAINATWTATYVSADTFSIPIDSSAFGTLAGTVVFATTAPRTGVYEWAVERILYDVSGNAVWKGWLAGSVGYNARCSDANTTTLNQQ